ncbi:MAG: DUF423 domain-containing protein [Candidatus Margulisiibacteriota bacterium]
MSSIIFGILYAVLSIMSGAFIQHAMQDQLSVQSLNALQTAAKYLFYNAVPLIILFFTNDKWQWPRLISLGFISFGLIFSGSIFLLVFTSIRWVAYLTPIGGIGIILSWIFWLIIIIKKN